MPLCLWNSICQEIGLIRLFFFPPVQHEKKKIFNSRQGVRCNSCLCLVMAMDLLWLTSINGEKRCDLSVSFKDLLNVHREERE